MVNRMEYELSNLTDEIVDTTNMERVIDEVSRELKVKNGLVSFVFVDNKKIREINKEYRGIDRETDVISFAFMDEDINPDTDYTNYGEIYISLEKTLSQSLEYGHSFDRELCFLTVHGLLHLLGYDHMTKEDEKVMFSLQDKILNKLGIERQL